MPQPNSDFTSYFDSYARKSPARLAYVALTGNAAPGMSHAELVACGNPDGYVSHERVTPANYPKLYNALAKECTFRNVEMPACYVDTSSRTALGVAYYGYETICVGKAAYDIFNEKELRALVAHELKHLYQAVPTNAHQSRMAEYDCDRAAVESTDYPTIRSYVHKSIILMIDRVVPPFLQPIAKAFHKTFPNLLGEWFFVPLDAKHPSPAARMGAMKEHAKRCDYRQAVSLETPTASMANHDCNQVSMLQSEQKERDWGAYVRARQGFSVDSGLNFQANIR